MVSHKGGTSNQLFNVLGEWEKNLKRSFRESPVSVPLPAPAARNVILPS